HLGAVLRRDARCAHAARAAAYDKKIDIVIGHGVPQHPFSVRQFLPLLVVFPLLSARAVGRQRRFIRRMPPRAATITGSALPLNKPCSMRRGTLQSRPASSRGSGIARRWASKIQCPPSVTKTCSSLVLRKLIGPMQPAAAIAASTARRVAAAPNGAISMGS